MELWFQWVLATSIGLAIGSAVDGAARTPAFGTGPGVVSIMLIVPAVVGISQWLVLRQQFSRASRWLIPTVLGWIVGFLVVGIVGYLALLFFWGPMFWFESLSTAETALGMLGVGIVVGGLIGIGQCSVLRQRCSKANWWVLTSILGWTVGFVLWEVGTEIATGGNEFATLFEPISVKVMRGFGLGAVAGAGYGTITGLALLWLLRHPRSEAASGARPT